MKTFFTFFLVIIFSVKGFACLNGETRTLKDGTFIYEDSDGKVPYGHRHFNEDDLNKTLIKVKRIYNETQDVDYLSDKGLILILLGKYDDAIKLYIDLEKTNPNRYSTASNIGTAYELKGDHQNALKWIKRSVEIDPKSHHNSEWIHIKILEAKINGEKNISSQSLINTDFGENVIPETSKKAKELQNLYDAIYFQVNERVTFIKSKDKMIAQLYFDLGNIAFLQKHFEDSQENYQMAIEYGFSGNLIQKRISEIKNQNEINQSKVVEEKKAIIKSKAIQYEPDYKISGFVFLGVILLIFFYFKFRKKI